MNMVEELVMRLELRNNHRKLKVAREVEVKVKFS
jgi:hypothetical protein